MSTSAMRVIRSGRGGDATTCVDDPATTKTSAAHEKLLAAFAKFCPIVPTVAVNDNVEDSSETALAAANGLAHDLFGGSVVVASDDATAKCEQETENSALKPSGANGTASLTARSSTTS
jgi:hypothetical protein